MSAPEFDSMSGESEVPGVSGELAGAVAGIAHVEDHAPKGKAKQKGKKKQPKIERAARSQVRQNPSRGIQLSSETRGWIITGAIAVAVCVGMWAGLNALGLSGEGTMGLIHKGVSVVFGAAGGAIARIMTS